MIALEVNVVTPFFFFTIHIYLYLNLDFCLDNESMEIGYEENIQVHELEEPKIGMEFPTEDAAYKF